MLKRSSHHLKDGVQRAAQGVDSTGAPLLHGAYTHTLTFLQATLHAFLHVVAAPQFNSLMNRVKQDQSTPFILSSFKDLKQPGAHRTLHSFPIERQLLDLGSGHDIIDRAFDRLRGYHRPNGTRESLSGLEQMSN